jgi:hypothetical protein
MNELAQRPPHLATRRTRAATTGIPIRTDIGRLLRAVASRTDNRAVPAYWTASRIANQIHLHVLGPHGFTRRGCECERQAGGLRKTLTVLTRTVSARPQVQLLVVVAVAGLPMPVTGHRSDSLGGTADTPTGRHHYPLPSSADPLPADLLADEPTRGPATPVRDGGTCGPMYTPTW